VRLFHLALLSTMATGEAAAAGAAAPGATSTAPAADVFGVVIGYNGGQQHLPTLRFADDDAIRLGMVLKGLDTPERRVRVWTLTTVDAETGKAMARAGLDVRPDGPPTRTALERTLAEIAHELAARPRVAPPPVFYLMYAGHGLPGRVLLQPETGPEAAITGREIRAAIVALLRVAPGLRPFVFVDACRSQSLFAPRGKDAEIGPDLASRALSLERSVDSIPLGVLTASAWGKPAGEVDGLSAGSFSYVLASGLAGGADVDGNQVVSFGELVAFVALHTQRLTGQMPWFAPPGNDLAAPALDLRGPHARLELLADALPGRYRVEAVSGRPIFAEAFKDAARTLQLVLPAGHYRLLRFAPAGGTTQASIELQSGQALDVATIIFATAGAGAAEGRTRGEEDSDDEGPPRATNPDDSHSTGEPDAEPAEMAFSEPFLPGLVTTLVAGYDAGRAPPETGYDVDRAPADAGQGGMNVVAVAGVLAAPPLGVGGTERGIALSYRRQGVRWFAGGRLAFGRSDHGAGADQYLLDRFVALAEAGPVWALGSRLEARLAAGLGAASIVQRFAGGAPDRGDPLALSLGGGAAVDGRVAHNVSVGVQGRVQADWIRLDAARKRFVTPTAELTASLQF